MKYFARLWTYVRPYTRLALASLVVMILTGLIGLAVPWPLKLLVDNVFGSAPLPGAVARVLGPFGGSRVSLLCAIVVAGLLLSLLENALGVIANYVNTRLEQHV